MLLKCMHIFIKIFSFFGLNKFFVLQSLLTSKKYTKILCGCMHAYLHNIHNMYMLVYDSACIHTYICAINTADI